MAAFEGCFRAWQERMRRCVQFKGEYLQVETRQIPGVCRENGGLARVPLLYSHSSYVCEGRIIVQYSYVYEGMGSVDKDIKEANRLKEGTDRVQQGHT